MAKRVWEFTLEDGNHTVEAQWGFPRLARLKHLAVDGIPVKSYQHIMQDKYMEYHFQVSNDTCILLPSEIEEIFGLREVKNYDLSVNGRLIEDIKAQQEGKKETDKVTKLRRQTRHLRKGLGLLNIYFVTFLHSFLPFIFLVLTCGFTYSVIQGHVSWWFILFAFAFGLGVYIFVVKNKDFIFAWRDVFSKRSTLIGHVRSKSSEYVSNPHGGGGYDYWITVDGDSFKVSHKIYLWLSIGSEIAVSHWPHTKTVASVRMLSA